MRILWVIPVVALVWYLDKDPFCTTLRPYVYLVSQREGEAVALKLPVRAYAGAHEALMSTKTLDLKGNVLTETAQMRFIPSDEYRLLTDPNLPAGAYNIDIDIKYKTNPLTWNEHSFTLAVLKVEPL